MAGSALAIKEGGTSQTTAPGARIALGLEIGVNIQAWDADLDAISALAGTGIAVRTAANTWATRTLTAPAAGITITNPAGIAGNPTFVLANDLAALEGMAGTGLVARTAAETYAQRTLQAPAAGITITNPAGIAGDPTFALADDLAALEALSGTNTIYYRSAANTWTAVTFNSESLNFTSGEIAVDFGANGIIAQTAAETFSSRTITGTANKITVTNGDGVSGNPTLTIPDAVTLVDLTVSTSLILPQAASPTPTAEGSIAWDTDDDIIRIGDGSATRTLSKWEFIRVQTPSSASSVDFTDLSAYRVPRCVAFLRPATDAVSFYIRTSTDNGSSFDAGASDYTTTFHYYDGDTVPAGSSGAAAQINPTISGIGNVAPEGCWVDFTIHQWNQSTVGYFIGSFGELNNATAPFNAHWQAYRNSTTARNALRLIFSSGNVATGYAYLEGIRG